MDDVQIDVMTVLIAQHIVDIARSDEHIAFVLRSRLLGMSNNLDNVTQLAINAIIEDILIARHNFVH